MPRPTPASAAVTRCCSTPTPSKHARSTRGVAMKCSARSTTSPKVTSASTSRRSSSARGSVGSGQDDGSSELFQLLVDRQQVLPALALAGRRAQQIGGMEGRHGRDLVCRLLLEKKKLSA